MGISRLVWLWSIPISALALVACQAPAPEPVEEPVETAEPAAEAPGASFAEEPNPCGPPWCGDDCSNQPYKPTDCWTTPYGPAKADIVIGDPLTSSSMLYCEGGAYALCFYSGPPDPTGRDGNDALPCTVDGDIANCTCQVYTSGPYYVAITSILNLGAYYETVETCGEDGSRCQSLASCGPDGDGSCDSKEVPPVCQYVEAQDPNDDSVSLIPGADLISTFSFAMASRYPDGSTPCQGLYAGCMTAACFFDQDAAQPPSDGDPITCQCPLYDGTYQIGQLDQQANCPIPQPGDGERYVWSASNAVPAPGS